VAQADNGNTNEDRYFPIPISGPLDEYTYPARGPRGLLQQAQNVVYRRLGALGKRTGSGPYGGAGSITGNKPVISGVRWYRGVPTPLKQMIVQSNNVLWKGNDGTGVFTALGGQALAASATPAYFASSYDPSDASDILIVAYGTGAPIKYDGTNPPSFLNASITNPFAGTYFWHEHVWFWGDPSFPDTVFATDLGNPESYAFSTNFGGYQQGRGDGDATVTGMIDNGSALLAFKNKHIYAIQGYDFVQGEYPFSDLPLVTGIGSPSGKSLANLGGNIIFWGGQQFYSLAPGNILGQSAPTPIGTPLVNTLALAATGSQSAIRACAGDFLVMGPNGPIVYDNCYLCALDINNDGVAEVICIYDASASAKLGGPAWTVWTNLNIGCLIPWGGPGDQNLLYFGDARKGQVNQIGQIAANDSGVAIPVAVTLLQDDAGTPDRIKRIDRVFLELQSNAAIFTVLADAQGSLFAPPPGSQPPFLPDNAQTAQVTAALANPSGALFGTGIFGQAIFGSGQATRYQSARGDFNGAYPGGRNVTFTITEESLTSLYELVGLTYHAIVEPVAW
jgi:hypothetical protein